MQSRMQIALPGSLHRVIVSLCTQFQLTSTAEAHDADRPAGLAASCHRVAVYSVTAYTIRGLVDKSFTAMYGLLVLLRCRALWLNNNAISGSFPSEYPGLRSLK